MVNLTTDLITFLKRKVKLITTMGDGRNIPEFIIIHFFREKRCVFCSQNDVASKVQIKRAKGLFGKTSAISIWDGW